MAKRGTLGRAIALFILDLALLVAMAVWFDYLGIWDLKTFTGPVYSLLGAPARNPQRPSSDLLLLDEERHDKQLQALDLRSSELDRREADLKAREEEFAQRLQGLEELEKSLDDREASFTSKVRAHEERSVNVEQNARYVMGMDPKKAVPILVAMDDQDVIDIMRKVEALSAAAGEDSIVPFWLSLMPPERAATIQRKMASKPLSLD